MRGDCHERSSVPKGRGVGDGGRVGVDSGESLVTDEVVVCVRRSVFWNPNGVNCGREMTKMCDFDWYGAVCCVMVVAVFVAELGTEGGWMKCVSGGGCLVSLVGSGSFHSRCVHVGDVL